MVIDGYVVLNKSNYQTETLSNSEKEFVWSVQSENLFKNSESLKWKDKNKEIAINNYYFEVVSIKKSEVRNFNLVTIKFDSKETNMKLLSLKLINFSGKELQKIFNVLFLLLIAIPIVAALIKYYSLLLKDFITNYLLKNYLTLNQQTVKPPRC